MDRYAIEQVLAPINGATFAGLDTVTDVKLLGGQKNPFQGKVEKHCLGHRVMLFTNKFSNAYENMVKRHLEQAGLDPATFSVGNLPWGERVPNSPFITCKDKLYLQVVFLEAGSTEYRIKEGEEVTLSPIAFWESGMTIEKQELLNHGLNEKTGSEHQGLERDKQVIVRTYCIDSITAIRAFGTELT